MTTIRSLIINVYDSIGYNTQPFHTLALLCYLTGRPGKGIVVTQVINIRVVLPSELLQCCHLVFCVITMIAL